MRYVYYILLVLICSSHVMFSQQISIDDSIGLQPLIENNLVDGCIDISNINSSVNGSASGFSSFAYFEKAGSNFPFENGIMLSTGGATSGGNSSISPTLSESSTTWGTDPDLETALGITNTLNATSIEFDIISTSNQFQFNYLLASEEYFGINPCQFSDGFVFLIKETGSTAPYQNIALVPGTSTPVNTNTIHDEIFGVCEAQNSQYFDGYNVGDTNYNGRTSVLRASTNITPYVQYHIKLIIADQTDGRSDSAVFIEGNSFKILDLGEDISTCASSAILDADLQNQFAFYSWYLNNNLINGATSPTLNVTQSGIYRVEVSVSLNSVNCVEEDEITVTLSTEEPINAINDYQLCDDSSNDQTEIFDLSTKNSELINNIPFTNYDFSYHYSETEARSNTNGITTPIPNTTNPQPIFVRIQDLDSNCFAYTTFNLIVNTAPNIIAPTALEVCDSDDNPDGFAVINLSEKNDEITAGQSELFVSYHFTPLDASTGDNPIPTPYLNTNTPSDQVYVRVVNTTTGCVNTTTLDVNITVSPIVNRDIQYINACDSDLDGNANFDLTKVINKILNGLTNVSTSFYSDLNDAIADENAIADETNYQYTNTITEPGFTTIYLRIEDNTTGCASIVPFEIHTNLLLTGTDTGDFALCDTNDDTTDTLDFNLSTVEDFIEGDLEPDSVTVTFYETEANRDNNIDPLPKNTLYSAISPQVLYIRVDNGDCVENTEITLLVNPILLFTPIDPIPYCDDDDDAITSIDLQSLDSVVTGGNTNFTVSYFPTNTDAQNNSSNRLPPFYTNTNPIETLYARIESDSGCSTVNPFQIEVLVAPTTTQPSNIVICDNDQDGLSIVNLNNKIPEIVANTTGLAISFHTSLDNANNNIDPITNPQNYETTTQTIYTRVEDSVSGTNCYAIVTFETIVNTLPIIPSNIEFQICESNGDIFADFLLADKDAEILNGQNGKEVFYFEDASFTSPIDKNNVYRNLSREQIIYIRVENITDPTCFDTSSITLKVSPNPIYNPITDYLICDDNSNDGIHEFNLSEKADEIRQGSPDILNISFHLTSNQADNNISPLPLTYTNTSNPQSLYIRIESNDSLCHIVEDLGINIIASPEVTSASIPSSCDADYDGITTFNLETANFQILDRVQSNLIINYFENLSDINQNDGLDNTLEITNPTNFPSSTKTVYIKVANLLTGCFSIIPLELIVNLPPRFNTINTIPICDNDTNTYDLSLTNSILINDTSLANISYHNTRIDAENNTSPLANIYNYTLSNHNIYARISDTNTGCHITTVFNLQINPNPIANTSPDVMECDNNFDADDTSQVNLATYENIILGTQNPDTFKVSYYNNLNEAYAAIPSIQPLNKLHQIFNGETIYARVENINTKCFDVSEFNTIINPLPIIPINDIVPLCINDLPLIIDANTGNSGDTYSWSTNVNSLVDTTTTSIIQVGRANLGEYSVTITTPSGCNNTKTFTVIESEKASNVITAQIDFQDPNSITIVGLSGIGDYVFRLDDGNTQTSNIFENVTFGPHVITVEDLNGCIPTLIPIFIFDIPKFFTPNGDSFFDTWHIIGANQLPGTLVYIYNRHGKLLTTLQHTSAGWDGTYNGQIMPSDDYWYVAQIIQDGESSEIKGHFTLKR
ncbi:hypothetical protein A8C32_06600 [Flavivirga aquatica]|uniref:Ig-like domain-containing protein n=1 Tax=Flavivirga aquatica TaxID=1849968 RepID=A0A1E5SIA7_9FLAO|nr:choice-of-anchor L domain-containing protein [Flavivirga aquatica]OEJ98852.1 hypothetical protein A8C32_06600 [Flavivirga aquatica]